MLTKPRSHMLEEVEQLLLVWIHEKQLAGDSVSEAYYTVDQRYKGNGTLLRSSLPLPSIYAINCQPQR
jgi:hypothetical protein